MSRTPSTPPIPTVATFLAPGYVAEVVAEPGERRRPGGLPDAPEAPAPADDSEPPGKRLARAIEAGLRSRGWHVDYAWTTYSGHAMDARLVTVRYDVELALVDAERCAWRLSARRRTGLLQSLFKRRPGEAEEIEHQLLRAHLEETLRADPDVALDEVAGAMWQPEST